MARTLACSSKAFLRRARSSSAAVCGMSCSRWRTRAASSESMFKALEIDALALGVDFMFAVILVPLGDRRVLVHVLDDLAPAYARVVGAEANFALLRGVRNDAHFGAAEVVVEKILEPHAGDEEEIPRILAALHGVINL